MIITLTQILSVKFTLSMPIYHSLYWKTISLWIHIFSKESKQRDVLYRCDCKLYPWFRQSVDKCCKAHPLSETALSINCQLKIKGQNELLLAKLISARILPQHSAPSAIPGRTGWRGNMGLSAAGYPLNRSCLWKVSPAKLREAICARSEILHTYCLADLCVC